MRKSISSKTLTLFWIFVLTIFPITTFAFSSGWYISSMHSDIQIQKNASIIVTETIVADFTKEPSHGIYRFIPVNYRDSYGNNITLDFRLISLKDETGNPWKYTYSKEGGNAYLKIGDADIYLNKISTFIITYEVNRAVKFFPDHDELYWNVNGPKWDTFFQKISATISFPETVSTRSLRAKCYTGSIGSEAENCTINIVDNKIEYSIIPEASDQTALNQYENLTIVALAPTGTIDKISPLQEIFWFIRDNWGYAVPFMVFVLMYYVWYKYGRDPQISRTAIMPRYAPPKGLTPAEIGTILDESADMPDISSTIIDLAVRGYIKIHEKKTKGWLGEDSSYEFEKTKEYAGDSTLKKHEILLMDGIFAGLTICKLDDLKNKFYKSIPQIKEALYEGLVKTGYFPSNPAMTRNLYFGIGGACIMGSFIFMNTLLSGGLSVPFAIIGTGVVIMLFANFMGKKTTKGAETYYEIKGLEEFIKTAEKDRLKFQEQENIFEKILPYAIALNLASKWSNAFAGIYKNPPNWYTSNDPNFSNNFTTIHLYSHLNSFNSSMQNTFASSPRSAAGGGSGFSGGFSGGGFGGGGGGRW